MVPPPHEIRPIGWNGIYCFLPKRWNIIVKGNCHLIIEQDFRPLLEFRWQNKIQSSPEKPHTDFILSQVHKETDKKPLVIKAPPFLQALDARYEVSAFTFDKQSHPAGAILTCRQSGTPILFQFINTTISSPEDLVSFFKTFSCCPEDSQNSHWTIEDLTFKIPQLFTLNTYSFSFGLTKFSFKTTNTNLKFCRLAAASKHIERYTFKRLFANFHENTADDCTVIDDTTLILDNPPSIGDHLARVIKRKKIYRWANFCHFTDQDKILGIHMESSQPLDKNQLAFIEKNYGFVQ